MATKAPPQAIDPVVSAKATVDALKGLTKDLKAAHSQIAKLTALNAKLLGKLNGSAAPAPAPAVKARAPRGSKQQQALAAPAPAVKTRAPRGSKQQQALAAPAVKTRAPRAAKADNGGGFLI